MRDITPTMIRSSLEQSGHPFEQTNGREFIFITLDFVFSFHTLYNGQGLNRTCCLLIIRSWSRENIALSRFSITIPFFFIYHCCGFWLYGNEDDIVSLWFPQSQWTDYMARGGRRQCKLISDSHIELLNSCSVLESQKLLVWSHSLRRNIIGLIDEDAIDLDIPLRCIDISLIPWKY